MNFRVSGFVIVKALDGRFNYGPAALEAALASEETGVFASKGEAANAAIREIKTTFLAKQK